MPTRSVMEAKKEHYDKLAEILKEVDAKLKEATDLADREGLSFSYSAGGYGMGGYYYGATYGSAAGEWKPSSYEHEADKGYWQASSQSC